MKTYLFLSFQYNVRISSKRVQFFCCWNFCHTKVAIEARNKFHRINYFYRTPVLTGSILIITYWYAVFESSCNEIFRMVKMQRECSKTLIKLSREIQMNSAQNVNMCVPVQWICVFGQKITYKRWICKWKCFLMKLIPIWYLYCSQIFMFNSRSNEQYLKIYGASFIFNQVRDMSVKNVNAAAISSYFFVLILYVYFIFAHFQRMVYLLCQTTMVSWFVYFDV